ncbi:hypothetical protein [Ottowia testudinis]|uniref:Uncharacterized protein n=1 Tax=Ottowia testudinis TaxID=2816950 RepID=A0A975CHT3_9BURK|nr:hypothetical protein [Ottowia testudinis]QTD46071.1 hypothetical protein J1M35_03940 [Ottowia testudinis]
MSPFDDLIADKGQPPLDKLTPLPAEQLARLRAAHPGLPEGYLDFLANLGFGELGEASFMLYSGLIAPYEAFSGTPEGLDGVWLFGDDFAGSSCGFDSAHGWRIVEIDPTNFSKDVVGEDFAAFIRIRIAAAG